MQGTTQRWLVALAAVLVVGSFAGAVAAAGGAGGGPFGEATQALGIADGDGDVDADAEGEMNTSYEEALATARDQLAREGNHSLTAVEVEPPVYEFEFVYGTASTVGEAEVKVDGGNGKVVKSEQEYEPRDGEDRIAGFEIVDGTPAPGANVTAKVTVGDDPLSNATVRLNEDAVGQTAQDGTVQVTLANEDESTLRVEDGEVEGELAFEFEERELDDDALDVAVIEGTPAPGETVTIAATLDGEPVKGATVAINDGRVGLTDANGTLSVDLPATEEVDIDIEYRDAEAELEFEFEEENEDEEEQEDEEDDDDENEEEEDENEEGEEEDEKEGEDENEDEDEGNEDEDEEEGEEEDENEDGDEENEDEDEEEGEEEEDENEDEDEEDEEGDEDEDGDGDEENEEEG